MLAWKKQLPVRVGGMMVSSMENVFSRGVLTMILDMKENNEAYA